MSEYRTIVNCTKPLEAVLRSIDRDMVHLLNQEDFITQEVHDDVLNPRCILNNHQKAGELVTEIRNKVEESAKNYHVLVSHLRQSGRKYEAIVGILDREYNRQKCASKIKLDEVRLADNVQLKQRYPRGTNKLA